MHLELMFWDNRTLVSFAKSLLTLGGSSTRNDLDKLARDNGLTSAVEKNLELGDHVSSVLGSVL